MKLAIIGYGKMGKAIEEVAIARGHKVILKVTSADTGFQKDLKDADVAIEFTNPASAVENIYTCFNNNIPVVVGTTGWLERLKDVKQVCNAKNQALLYASNFSIGVNIFFEINKNLARLMKGTTGYDVSMKEIHHTQKLDAPSGTALTLANDIIELLDTKTHWTLDNPKDNTSLNIVAERTGLVPGTHIISYTSDVDTITITHEAHNRKGFALGAVIAAEWIIGKKGIFEMRDVLNINPNA